MPTRPARSERKRAALIATAVTIPVIVIVALLLGALAGSSPDSGPQNGPLPPLTATAPPNATAETTPCTDLLEALPVQLNTLAPRVVDTTPSSPFVVAWGNPAIVLSCGVDKPADLVAGSDDELRSAGGNPNGAYYDVSSKGSTEIFTAVDRQAFVSIAVPSKYQPADYLAILNTAVLKAMPKPVCSTLASEPDPDKLCSRRTT